MSQNAAALGAMTISFVAFGLAAAWYAWPWLRERPPRTGLTLLLWIHVFRYVALQIFSSVRAGFEISPELRDQIVYGDLIGAAAALLAILLLRLAPRYASPALWLFLLVTVADLANAGIGGAREGAFATASDVTWLILTFYVPLLWVSTALVAALTLRARRS